MLDNLHIVLLLYDRLVILALYQVSRFTCLPGIQLVLLRLVVLDKVIQDLFQPVLVCLKCWDHVLDRSLDKDTIDEAKAFAVLG